MRKFKFILLSALTLLYIGPALTSCEGGIERYNIDAPDDIQQKIDSIAEEKAKIDTGDTVYVTIANSIVGAEDCSTGWDGATSQWFAVPSNRLLHIDFINHGSEANNWNNWNLRLADASENKVELFVIRSDAYGWGNADFALSALEFNYGELASAAGIEDLWEYFRSVMDGARVEMEIDHSKTGNVYVTATMYAQNGDILVEKYHQPVSATEDIYATLVCDGSWFDVKKAYTVTSKVQALEDFDAVSISVAGMPQSLEIGQSDFWGNAVATVTFADGSQTVADTADITFTVIPDLSSVGEKTVVLSYSKTKLGQAGATVLGYYKLNVVNNVVSIDVTRMPALSTYYIFDQLEGTKLRFDTCGIVVTATYADNTTGVIANDALVFDSIPAAVGTPDVKITYKGSTSEFTTTCKVNVVKGTSEVGKADYSNAWWTTFTPDVPVQAGDSVVLKAMLYSRSAENYHSPCVILRNAALVEYAVSRMDHFGWGTSWTDDVVKTSNWNWDFFKQYLTYSLVTITVKNNGNGTADIRYDVVYPNGENHFQYYTNIAVDSADLQTAIVLESSYMVFFE
jgi:hypothetical protein